jgi:hypothetical protein
MRSARQGIHKHGESTVLTSAVRAVECDEYIQQTCVRDLPRSKIRTSADFFADRNQIFNIPYFQVSLQTPQEYEQ